MDSENNILAELSEKTDDELRAILDSLYEEEKELSYRRRLLHAKIDILRADLTARLKEKRQKGESVITGRDLERLAEILASESRVKGDI